MNAPSRPAALQGYRAALSTALIWAGFMLLTFATFAVPGRPKAPWLAAFGLELLLSFGGFFSSFKMVFFYALFGLVASINRPMRLLGVGVIFSFLLAVSTLAWTAIKDDYRDFLNQGSGQQVVLVSYGDSIRELGRQVTSLNGNDLAAAAEAGVRRLMYFEFFGVAADRVPATIPHAGGEIWGESISSPFMPRMLFPDKREVHDSELTNRYTGLGLATHDQGTSISMGYMAEAFIDFGPIFMFVPLAALGLAVGLFYRWLLSQPGFVTVVGAAMAPAALMPAHLLETSVLKMVPSLVLSFLACFVILKVFVPLVLGVPDSATRAKPQRRRLRGL